MTAWTSGGDPLTYEPVLEDPRAEHQIVIRAPGHEIVVCCTCMRREYYVSGAPIASGTRLTAADAVAAWRAWHTGQGVTV